MESVIDTFTEVTTCMNENTFSVVFFSVPC